MRSEPQATATEVTRFALGTIVEEQERTGDGQWRRVRGPGGQTGWIFGNLTAPFDGKNPADAYRRLAEARLKLDTTSFAERVDLLKFLDRVIPSIQGPQLAELEFLRLSALKESIKDFDRYTPENPAYRDWISQHESEFAYSEPAGQWLLQSELYWRLEAKHHGQPIAENIAWSGAHNGLPGECEGYIPCHLRVVLLCEGRYVDLYPTGVHVEEALDSISSLLDEILKPNTPYNIGTSDGAQLEKDAAQLAAILQKTTSPRKMQLIELVKAMVQRYR